MPLLFRVMRTRLSFLLIVVIIGLAIGVWALLSALSKPSTSAPVASGSAPTPTPAILIGAGDVAECPTRGDEATADLLDQVVGEHPEAVVFTTGDNVYPGGAYDEFIECYEPSWGRHKERTRPAVGNHEFKQTKAGGYHRYWGERGGPFDEYFYSYDVGGWHVVVLNSECHRVGCEFDSDDGTQVEWLAADLEASAAECTIAIWHHPRWSSGRYGSTAEYQTFWEVLYEAGAEIVLNGHEHLYERFAPLRPDGTIDRERGIRQFTVGTGGANLRGFEEIEATSRVRGSEHGVLKLTLHAEGYEWEFLAVDGATFTDAGTGSCH